MISLPVVNLLICIAGMTMGGYVLCKDLHVFKKNKSPATDTWLVMVGMMSWSVFLLMAIQAMSSDLLQTDARSALYGGNIFARFLFLIYWAGTLLQVKKHCQMNFKRLLKQKRLQKEQS